MGAAGELRAAIGGRFRFEAGDDPAAFPAVGDWVALDAGDGAGGRMASRRCSRAGPRWSGTRRAVGPSPR